MKIIISASNLGQLFRSGLRSAAKFLGLSSELPKSQEWSRFPKGQEWKSRLRTDLGRKGSGEAYDQEGLSSK